MFINYLDNRKLLGYPALKDTECGIKLVVITDLVTNKSKRVIVVICLGMLLIVGNVDPSEAKDPWFLPGAEGFTPPISKPGQSSPGYFDSKPARGASGQNPAGGGGGGNQNPSSGSDAGSCSSNPTPKASAEGTNYGFGSSPQTRKQKELKKRKKELEEAIQEEKKINAKRKKQDEITVMIKDGRRFFAANKQLRDKFHHAPDLNSPIPRRLGNGELERLANNNLHGERLKTFRNREILPDAFVKKYGQDLRSHVHDPDTIVIEGTFGANREANGGQPKTEGYHLYNDRTGFNAFFDQRRRYRTGFEVTTRQKNDILNNGNMS